MVVFYNKYVCINHFFVPVDITLPHWGSASFQIEIILYCQEGRSEILFLDAEQRLCNVRPVKMSKYQTRLTKSLKKYAYSSLFMEPL